MKMQHLATPASLFLIIPLFVLPACDLTVDAGADAGTTGCIAGQSIACVCTDGRMGAQSCNGAGSFNPCACTSTPGTGDGMDSETSDGGMSNRDGGQTDAGSDGGTTADAGQSDGGKDGGTTGGVKRIFVTSSSYTGNLGGLAGADAKCQTSADGALLGGTWIAWLSLEGNAAIDRVSGVGPWFLVDGVTRVFNNKANLQSTALRAIALNEFGQSVSDNVWTGTETGGQPSGYQCSGWTSASASYGSYGRSDSTSHWTYTSSDNCYATNRLYCIEQ